MDGGAAFWSRARIPLGLFSCTIQYAKTGLKEAETICGQGITSYHIISYYIIRYSRVQVNTYVMAMTIFLSINIVE